MSYSQLYLAFAVKMFAISDGVLLTSLEPASRITLHIMPAFYVYELSIGLSTFHALPTPLLCVPFHKIMFKIFHGMSAPFRSVPFRVMMVTPLFLAGSQWVSLADMLISLIRIKII